MSGGKVSQRALHATPLYLTTDKTSPCIRFLAVSHNHTTSSRRDAVAPLLRMKRKRKATPATHIMEDESRGGFAAFSAAPAAGAATEADDADAIPRPRGARESGGRRRPVVALPPASRRRRPLSRLPPPPGPLPRQSGDSWPRFASWRVRESLPHPAPFR